jgi:hypothetical protein
MKRRAFKFTRRDTAVAVLACLVGVCAVSPNALAKLVDKEAGDNSGRQIAIVMPEMPKPSMLLPAKNVSPPGKSKPSSPLIQTSGRMVKITVPKTVDEAADAAWVTSNKLYKEGCKKAAEIQKWAIAWYKQNNSMPMATPAGSPYAQVPSGHVHQLYYTHEGRLKTVVKR